jgi:hypothetical protein
LEHLRLPRVGLKHTIVRPDEPSHSCSTNNEDKTLRPSTCTFRLKNIKFNNTKHTNKSGTTPSFNQRFPKLKR